MGRGVSSGGGQSSLGYLFGSGEEAPKPTAAAARNVREASPQSSGEQIASSGAPQKNAAAPVAVAPPADATKKIPSGPAGVPAATTNNYFRADGQNCGNFLTDRPTTKVHAAPGGGSSLDYLFGGSGGGLLDLASAQLQPVKLCKDEKGLSCE